MAASLAASNEPNEVAAKRSKMAPVESNGNVANAKAVSQSDEARFDALFPVLISDLQGGGRVDKHIADAFSWFKAVRVNTNNFIFFTMGFHTGISQ